MLTGRKQESQFGRLPKDRSNVMQPVIPHDRSEFDHWEMALGDFGKLGGDEACARPHRITPASLI
jgi:hypothetical protein